MAYTGITSAVGLAIESQFCQPPLSGTNPATVGIAGTNPLRYMIVEPGGGFAGEPELNLGAEIEGDVQLLRAPMVGRKYQGAFRFYADPENLFYPLLGVFGRDIASTQQAASGTNPAVYQHQFLPGRQIPSFSVEEDIGDGTWARLSTGVLVQKLELQLARLFTAEVALLAHRQLPNRYPDGNGHIVDYFFGATPTLLPPAMGGNGSLTVVRTPPPPSFVDVSANGGGPFVFAEIAHGTQAGFASAWLQVDGNPIAVDLLEGSCILFEREIQSVLVAGSGYDPGAAVVNRFLCSGRLVCLYEGMDLPEAALAARQVGLNFAVTGIGIGSTGLGYHMEVHLPNLRLVRAPLPLTEGMLAIDADFVALRDPVLGYTAKVTLVNTVNATTLGGQLVSGSGSSGSSPQLSGIGWVTQ